MFPLHASTNFVCPTSDGPCPIKARIRDFGSCLIRIFAIESLMPRRASDRLRHEASVKGEYLVKECAECPFNRIAERVIRELLHPSARAEIHDEREFDPVDNEW